MIAAIVIMFTFLNKENNNSDYKEALKAKDDIIKTIIAEREADRAEREALIMDIRRKDSLLQLKYKTVIIQNEKIPVFVSGLSDSALRSAVEAFR